MTNYNLLLNIAFQLLKARLKQTIVAAIGVTFSISMFITLNGFMNGLNNLLDGLMLSRTPHILLYNDIIPSEKQPVQRVPEFVNSTHIIHSVKAKDRGKSIYNNQLIIKTLKADPLVSLVAPKVTAPVFFNSGSIEIAGIINGIDSKAEEKLFSISQYITEGNIRDLDQNNSIIIGKGLAVKMRLSLGDVIRVTSSKGYTGSLKIMGFYQVGISEIDNVIAYASIATTQQLLNEPANYITDIQLKLYDISLAPALAQEFHEKFNTDTIDYQTANKQFETGSTIRNIISYTVGLVLLTVAGFGIYNILNMMIFEKMDSIAILKATGFSGHDVKYIFISLSIIIGASGGALGLVLGYFFSLIVDQIPFNTESLPTITTYPVSYQGIYYAIGMFFALFTTAIAGFFPAMKASKVDPVEIIRGK
jgi:lipoprotein-releasing system permease protein